jgi:hypothetical protein
VGKVVDAIKLMVVSGSKHLEKSSRCVDQKRPERNGLKLLHTYSLINLSVVTLCVLSELAQDASLFINSNFKLICQSIEALNTLRAPLMHSTVNSIHLFKILLNMGLGHSIVFSQLEPIAAQEGI